MSILKTSANDLHSLQIKEGFASVPGGEVWYQIYEPKNSHHKLPVLIVHGGPGVPHDYLNILSQLGTDRPVIFYDQLGCGHSQVSNGGPHLWQLSRYVTEFEDLVKTLGLKRFILFGHSWGGTIATEYALHHPDQVAGLVLASPLLNTKLWIEDSRRLLGKLPPDIQEKILRHEQQGTTESEEYKDAAHAFYNTFVCRLNPFPNDLKEAFDKLNVDIYRTMWGPSEFTMTGNLKELNLVNDLIRLKMPVLLTCGRFDEATPETLQRINQNLSNGQVVVFEKSAHVPHLEEPKNYRKTLKDFFQSVEENES